MPARTSRGLGLVEFQVLKALWGTLRSFSSGMRQYRRSQQGIGSH